MSSSATHDRRGRSFVSMDLAGRGATRRWAALGVVAFVVVTIVAAIADAAFTSGAIHPGVHVSGVDVGWLTRAQAARKISGELSPRYAQPVTISYGSRTWRVVPASLDASVDGSSSADAAWAVGRREWWLPAALTRLSAWVAPRDVTARTAVTGERFSAVLDEIAGKLGVAAVDAGVTTTGTEFAVVDGKPGVQLERRDAIRDLLTVFPRTEARTVELKLGVQPVGITRAEAAAAAAAARIMVSAPVTITYKGRSWQLTTGQIARAVEFRVVAASAVASAGVLVPAGPSDPPASSTAGAGGQGLGARLSPDRLAQILAPLTGALGRPAVNARFTISGGNVAIVPAIVGYGADSHALARDLTASLRVAGSPRKATLRLAEITPKITTRIARGMGIVQRISTFSTDYSSGNVPRVNNIHLLSKAIDGSLVAPGAVWSLNGQVGERTAAKGYAEANAIVKGKLVPQLGGGICQVATTVFNAIFFAGEQVVERENHSFYISHYPMGRDATVSWGGPDLKFRNDTGHWIWIHTATDASSVTVSLYGAAPGYAVSLQTSPLKKTGDFTTQTVPDPKLPTGTQVVKNPGVAAYTVTVVRTVTKSGAVVRKDTFVSNYKPMVEVVSVGTGKVVPPKGSGTTTSTAGR